MCNQITYITTLIPTKPEAGVRGITLCLQVTSQECRAYLHLMDLEIILGGDGECQPDVVQASCRRIRSMVVDAINLVISSTD